MLTMSCAGCDGEFDLYKDEFDFMPKMTPLLRYIEQVQGRIYMLQYFENHPFGDYEMLCKNCFGEGFGIFY